MAQLLEKLIQGAPTYEVRPENEGFTLVGKPDRLDEFSHVVRETVNHAGDDFVVFPMSDGQRGYSQMFVMPLDDTSGAR